MAQGRLPLGWRRPRIALRSSPRCPHRPPIRISGSHRSVRLSRLRASEWAPEGERNASGRRRLVLMRYYVGFDVGKGAHWVCVLDGEGRQEPAGDGDHHDGRVPGGGRRPFALRLARQVRRSGRHRVRVERVGERLLPSSYRRRAKRGNRILKRVFYQSAHCAVLCHERSARALCCGSSSPDTWASEPRRT